MKFDKILEYQSVDMELTKLKTTLAETEQAKNFTNTQNKLNNVKKILAGLNQEAADLLKTYSSITSQIADINEELSEFEGIMSELDDANDTAELDHYLKLVSNLSNKLNALESEAQAAAKKIDQINSQYTSAWNQGIELNTQYNNAKKIWAAYRGQYEPKMEELTKRLQEIGKEIPEKVMSIYNTFKASGKLPVFIEYDPTKKVCGRCRMELDNGTIAKLRNPGDYAECPNCRRILFIKD